MINHRRQERWRAGLPGLVPQQAGNALLREPLAPASDRGSRETDVAPNRGGAVPVGGGEGDLGPPDVLLWAIPICQNRLEMAAVGRAHADGGLLAHSAGYRSAGQSGML